MTIVKDEPVSVLNIVSVDVVTEIPPDLGAGEFVRVPYSVPTLNLNRKSGVPNWVVLDGVNTGRFALQEGIYHIRSSMISHQGEAVANGVQLWLQRDPAGVNVIEDGFISNGYHPAEAATELTLNVHGTIQISTPTEYEVQARCVTAGNNPQLGNLGAPFPTSGSLTIHRMDFAWN